MGCFSWLKANEPRYKEHFNILNGENIKLLIPEEFVKDSDNIIGKYDGYGRIRSKTDIYDIYELFAFWNNDIKDVSITGSEKSVKSLLKYDGDSLLMKSIDEYTDHNRSIGIDIEDMFIMGFINIKYPIKLVSAWYDGSYESCSNYSVTDPNQGSSKLYKRNKYITIINREVK